MMKARFCWNFRLPKRSSTSLQVPRRNTDAPCRHLPHTEVLVLRAIPEKHPLGRQPSLRSASRRRSTEFSMQDIWRLPAKDIAALIRSKELSAKEAASAALARLDAVNPAINAVV